MKRISRNSIGKFIKDKRYEFNYSQKDLADMLGVSKEAISNWENGTSSPSVNLWVPLSHIFGITIDEFLFSDAETNAIEYDNVRELVLKIDNEVFCNKSIVKKMIDLLIECKLKLVPLYYEYYANPSLKLKEKIKSVNKFDIYLLPPFCDSMPLKTPIEDIMAMPIICDDAYISANVLLKNEQIVFCLRDDPFFPRNDFTHTDIHRARIRTSLFNFIYFKGGKDLFIDYVDTFSQGYKNDLLKKFYENRLDVVKNDLLSKKILRCLLRAGCKYFIEDEDRTIEVWEKVAGDI